MVLVESLVFFLAGTCTLASVSLTVTQFKLLYNPILNIHVGNGVTFEDNLQLYTVGYINETAVSVSYEENRAA